MNDIKVLDVTLRDGGCVNNFNFGKAYMKKILEAEEKAGIDIIELGYIDDRCGSYHDRTQYINEVVIREAILSDKQPGITYVSMIDHGKYDFKALEKRTLNGIDGIRLAFHKKDWKKAILEGKIIMEKGYLLYIQPMLTMRYSEEEFLELISTVNRELPEAKAFYIVDSFGEMRANELSRILKLVDNHLTKQMNIGFHSHNNLQMSYSNAITMLQFKTHRGMILDSSIMGMGKGAGNLNTELLLEHLNLFYQKKYNLSPLLAVMDEVVNQIHSEFYWGYAPEFYLSSVNHCTPSYASYFYDRHMLPIDQVSELLGMIDEEQKISFDQVYAENLYRRYNEEKTVDDQVIVEELQKELSGKRILLIAPGKSIVEQKEKIYLKCKEENVISIGLNVLNGFDTNYVLATREEVYAQALKENRNVIVASNLSKGGRGNVKVLNYSRWIEVDEETHDSSTVIILNLLRSFNVKEIIMAGFDGFSVDINANYYDISMRHPVKDNQARKRNAYYRKLIQSMRDAGLSINFLTKSKYDSCS